MKIIFCDVDGVLCTHSEYNKMLKQTEVTPDYYPFNGFCVKMLNEVINETGANIVVSSDWREQYSLADLTKIFDGQGVRGQIIDLTPIFEPSKAAKRRGDDMYVEKREREIDDWMRRHRDIESWCAIDDMELSSLGDNFVRTWEGAGLTMTCAEKAIQILNK